MSQMIETEETLIIETPERVPLAFALASIGNRFLAVAIDHLIQYFAIFIVVYSMLSLTSSASTSIVNSESAGALLSEMPKWTIALMILFLFAIFSGYFVVFETIWNGQTPGKRLLKLRVIREDGRPITLWEAMTRNLLRVFDAIPGFFLPLYSIGLITIFLNRRDQRVGDIFAGTVVIRERTDEAPTFAETFSTKLTDSALIRVQPQTLFDADVRIITENEIEVVESFLRRRFDLNEKQRTWMAWRVALPIMYKLKPRYNAATFSYEGFLEELVNRFHSLNRFNN